MPSVKRWLPPVVVVPVRWLFVPVTTTWPSVRPDVTSAVVLVRSPTSVRPDDGLELYGVRVTAPSAPRTSTA